jgi:alpha-beta hydrolase superfamily lysophospholipase
VGQCSGWLHVPGDTVCNEVAILICPGLGHDLLSAHHSLRLLADDLAAAGYSTLRLAYPGVGDSGDIAGDDFWLTEAWQLWQASLETALDWLHFATGARRFVLCGVRIGATLAALVAEKRADVTGLLLLAPVWRGRSYLQQLHVETRFRGRTVRPLSEGLKYYDIRFGPDTVRQITEVDLRQVTLRPSLPVAIFEQSGSTLGAEVEGIWSKTGVQIDRFGFNGLEPLLRRYEEEGEAPPVDFSTALDWLERAGPGRPMQFVRPHLPLPTLLQSGWVEMPQRFGLGDGLVGMLCRPERGPSETAVIIVNAGRDPHYGFSRFGLELARSLAQLGISSLRFSFAGHGDSIGPPGKETTSTAVFDTDRRAEIAAAADRLVELGYRHLVVHGSCSGAYHALWGAVADPRIDTLLLLNLPFFEWHRGDTAEFASRRTMRLSWYLLNLWSWRAWWRLSRHPLAVGSILAAQWTRLQARFRAYAQGFGWISSERAGHRALIALTRRGARTLFLFCDAGERHNGLDAWEDEFGRGPDALHGYPGAVLRIAQDADHLLSTRAMRLIVAQIMARFLTDGGSCTDGQRTSEFHQ